MLLKRQILSWISILVFFTSTTGVAIYEHICHSSNTKSVALNHIACDQDNKKSDDCCSGESSHSDCCDMGVSFEKYSPDGQTEQFKFSKIVKCELTTPQFFEWQEWNTNRYIESVSILPNPPNPHISNPKSVSERLADVQSYLC